MIKKFLLKFIKSGNTEKPNWTKAMESMGFDKAAREKMAVEAREKLAQEQYRNKERSEKKEEEGEENLSHEKAA